MIVLHFCNGHAVPGFDERRPLLQRRRQSRRSGPRRLKLEAGKPLDLCYGVAVWDGEVDKATVEALYQRWLKLSAGAKQ